MTRLRVESVSSSSMLRKALSPGDAGNYGDYDEDAGVLETASDVEATSLVDRYPNVYRVDDEPDDDGAGESPRLEADNTGTTPVCGVNGCSREVEDPEDTCWQHGGD